LGHRAEEAIPKTPKVPREKKSIDAEDVEKGDKPPAEWLDRCVERVKESKSDVDNPWAVCVATYQKMQNKAVLEGNIVKISVDDMRVVCPECAEKMAKANVKFLKVTVGSYTKAE